VYRDFAVYEGGLKYYRVWYTWGMNETIGGLDISTASGMIAALRYGSLEALLALVSGEVRRQGYVILANHLADAADEAGSIQKGMRRKKKE